MAAKRLEACGAAFGRGGKGSRDEHPAVQPLARTVADLAERIDLAEIVGGAGGREVAEQEKNRPDMEIDDAPAERVIEGPRRTGKSRS